MYGDYEFFSYDNQQNGHRRDCAWAAGADCNCGADGWDDEDMPRKGEPPAPRPRPELDSDIPF